MSPSAQPRTSRGHDGGNRSASAPIQRCHAQEIDLRAVRAVTRTAEKGRDEGRRAALQETARLVESHARRARVVLSLAVATALFLGFGAGVLVGARAPREPGGESPAGK